MTTLEVIYEDDWLTRTLKELHAANDEAKTLRSEYASVHRRINHLLDELEALT